jgi:hypothetical protein
MDTRTSVLCVAGTSGVGLNVTPWIPLKNKKEKTMKPPFKITYKAERTSDGSLLKITGSDTAPHYKVFGAAFGWRDPSGEEEAGKHAFLVGGKREDGAIDILFEHVGSLPELSTIACDYKDMLIIDRMWLDGSNINNRVMLQNYDGLTGYQTHGRDDYGNKLFDHDEKYWPNFRSRGTNTTLIPVPGIIRSDVISGMDRIAELVKKKLLVVKSKCIIVQTLLNNKERLTEIQNHPMLWALIFLVWGLDTTLEKPTTSGQMAQRLQRKMGSLK